ncbi:MAG: PAS domain S-box protein, partial [Terriglobia bacterium]
LEPLAVVVALELIEELEESHASLKEEKDFARNLVAHAHDPIAILEPDGHFSWTNEQCNAFTGYSLEEKRRLRLFDLLLPEDRAAAERQWRQVTQGSAGLCELRLRRKDGEVRHAIFSLSPIRASDDQLSGVLAIGRDITEQKQAERELARLAAYPNLNPNPVLECDAEGRITYANPAASRLLQTLSPARLLPRDFSERVKRCLEQNVELHGQETEANSQTLLWSFHPLPAINRVHIYAADITERKHAEEALRQSEEKYRTILENIEDGYFEVDLAGNLTFFNDSFRRLLGYPEEELLGMNNREYMDAENAKSVYQTFNNVYRTGIPAKESDWEIIQKDGAKRIVEGSVSLIWNATGESIGFRGVVRDITERRQAQLRLAESDRLAALGRLIAGVAHELNNPLQGILGFAELLQRRPALDTTEQRYAEQIQQESERAKKIVVNLLTFARQSRLEKTPVDLNALVQRILELRAYSLRLADVQLESRLRPLPPLHADAHRLQQVFLNLLLNAEQALEQIPDGRQLFVTTELADTPEGQVVRVSVRDTGLGIPRDHLSRIFEPFFTTKQPGEGTGLGLAIAYAIVREHGGTIELSSEPGHGTTAVVTLPVTPAAVQPAAAETNTAHEPGPTAGSNQGRGTVLVVDDEEAIREFLAEGLGAEGFRVDTAPNAHQALARLRAHRYDLVLCDIKMPGKSGIELFQEIHREQPDLDSRFIFITGDVMSPETREFLTNCPVRYLLKPFRVSDVRALLPNSP